MHIFPAMASQTQIYISQAEEEENLCPASQLLGKMEASATSLPIHKAWAFLSCFLGKKMRTANGLV